MKRRIEVKDRRRSRATGLVGFCFEGKKIGRYLPPTSGAHNRNSATCSRLRSVRAATKEIMSLLKSKRFEPMRQSYVLTVPRKRIVIGIKGFPSTFALVAAEFNDLVKVFVILNVPVSNCPPSCINRGKFTFCHCRLYLFLLFISCSSTSFQYTTDTAQFYFETYLRIDI